MMEMGEIPFHRIFTGTESSEDDIKCVDKIDAEDNGSCRYLTTRYYRKSRDNVTKEHRPRITHNTGTASIVAPEDEQCREENREK